VASNTAATQSAGQTPRSAGFYLPAEWEQQAAVWLSWPVSGRNWPDCREELLDAYARMAARISWCEPVHINAAAGEHAYICQRLNRARCDLTVTTVWSHPTDDVWCRDHGPIFLKHKESGELAIGDWQFNAWGEKFAPFDQDDAVPARIARALNCKKFTLDAVLEGGAIESNGAGAVLTTEAVLLNTNRYVEPTLASAEAMLCEGLGADRVIWLKDGIDNDDTDGHIDNVTRFVAPDAVLTVVDPAQPQLQINAEQLRRAIGNVIELPLPAAVLHEGRALPASYANFLILNDAVLVPVFGQPSRDAYALGVIADCFPGRKIESLDARVFLLEGGAIHCLSMQQPAG